MMRSRTASRTAIHDTASGSGSQPRSSAQTVIVEKQRLLRVREALKREHTVETGDCSGSFTIEAPIIR